MIMVMRSLALWLRATLLSFGWASKRCHATRPGSHLLATGLRVGALMVAFFAVHMPPLGAADATVTVESPGRNDKGEWRARDTRLVAGLEGYTSLGPVETNAYGGWTARREKATRFFYVQKVSERWWFVDPEGCLFLSQGINMIVEPANEQEMSDAFGGRAGWAKAVGRQLKNNSFNTAGGWSSGALAGSDSGLVRTVTMHVMESFAKKMGLIESKQSMSHFHEDCIPVFHPAFPAFCDDYCRRLDDSRNDPWILGIFSDNELPLPVELLDRCLGIGDDKPALHPNREAAREWLKANVPGGATGAVTAEHRQKFVAFVADRYYSVMREAIRKHDPNHLYLGSRLLALVGHIGKNEFFWRMIGKHLDVISINYYDVWGPDLDRIATWEGLAGKPLMITEWYAKAQDVPGMANTGGAGFLVRTQDDRAKYYQHFVLRCLESKRIVGWHWFKYIDDPPSSKRGDNAGGANKGFVDVNHVPYKILFKSAAEVQQEAYPLTTFFDRR